MLSLIVSFNLIVIVSYVKTSNLLQTVSHDYTNFDSQRTETFPPRISYQHDIYSNQSIYLKSKSTPRVHVVDAESDLPKATIGLPYGVIDSTTAKVQYFHSHKKSKRSRTNDGGLGQPTEVLLEYQDSRGQYSFGYSAPESARSEIRSTDGSTRGAFSYIDGSGVIQTAQYTADSENGFRIQASNLPQAPVPVKDTPEVQAARLEHQRIYEAAIKDAENTQVQEDCTDCSGNKENEEYKQQLVKSSSKLNTAEFEMADKQQNLTLSQLPQEDSLKKKNKNLVPFVHTSFILPSSNLNLQSRIDLKTPEFSIDASTESQPQETESMMMKEEVSKADELKSTQISQTQLSQQYYSHSTPSIVSISSYRIPVYSYNQHLHLIPSFYYY